MEGSPIFLMDGAGSRGVKRSLVMNRSCVVARSKRTPFCVGRHYQVNIGLLAGTGNETQISCVGEGVSGRGGVSSQRARRPIISHQKFLAGEALMLL